jgi:hypothetical protein
MTDVRAVTVFRPFGGNQFVFATNAVNSKGGAAIGYHRRHDSLFDADPDKTNLSTIQIGGESFSLMQENFYAAPRQKRRELAVVCCTASKRRLAFRP